VDSQGKSIGLEGLTSIFLGLHPDGSSEFSMLSTNSLLLILHEFLEKVPLLRLLFALVEMATGAFTVEFEVFFLDFLDLGFFFAKVDKFLFDLDIFI